MVSELEILILSQLENITSTEEIRPLILTWSHHFDANKNLLHHLNLKLLEFGYQIYGYNLHRLEKEDENRSVSEFAEMCLYPLNEYQLEFVSRFEYCIRNGNPITPYQYINLTPFWSLINSGY